MQRVYHQLLYKEEVEERRRGKEDQEEWEGKGGKEEKNRTGEKKVK